ncbi:hypothetical protein Ciccas_012069 [Cichlidogyrus casuarinus]|uniref:Uncharacterized protein n=1 Tax=Cichlidogyrus casuarinus TaxID=1844966 RepID=A0ABD2PQ63_9PLAT
MVELDFKTERVDEARKIMIGQLLSKITDLSEDDCLLEAFFLDPRIKLSSLRGSVPIEDTFLKIKGEHVHPFESREQEINATFTFEITFSDFKRRRSLIPTSALVVMTYRQKQGYQMLYS